jgi:Protein of unknown function (DUF3485)
MDTIRASTALVLILGAGLVHGAWTNRWRPSPELNALIARFASVPLVIGDWQGKDFEIAPKERAMAGAVACLSRRYSNPNRGISVSVLLLGGLPGNISVHTPDNCYPGAGYTLNAPASFDYRSGANKTSAGFRTALASRGGASPSTVRIFWSWNSSKAWVATCEPRWKFASARALCKLCVVRETDGAAVDPQSDPCNDFLSVFLPELDRLVFSNSE